MSTPAALSSSILSSSLKTKFARFDFSHLVFVLIALLCLAFVWQPLQGGEDFWAHAAIGRWICENARVPTQALWLWSTPSYPWVAHSWLGEVLFYLLMKTGGAHLVLLFTAVVVALPFLWAWRLWCARGGNRVLGALFFFLAISCASARFQPRPELFTYFFLTVLLLFLIHHSPLNRKLDWRTWGVVAMFALWANLHGAVVLGLVVLLMTWGCEALQRRSFRAAWPLLRLALLGAAAINFNPYGLRYWLALRQVGGDMFSMIDEWKSPLTSPALPPMAILFVVVIAFIALLAWLSNATSKKDATYRDTNWAQLAWLVFFTLLFFSARRNLWPAMLVAVLVASANAQTLRASSLLPSVNLSDFSRHIVRAATSIALLAWLASAISPEILSQENGKTTLRAVSRFAPSGVAEYVLQQNPPDPIFNDYLRSNYFSWRFAGRRELYIDVHNAYPAQLLRDYFDVIARTPRGVRAFDDLKINTVIFGRWDAKVGRLAPMAQYLDASPEWHREYSGEDGAVWVRKSASNLKRVNKIPDERAR